MISTKIGVLFLAAFVAGAFVASPELRAYAANTVFSSDIVDGTITTADIGDGQVKNADLGGNAVSTSKINDGAVKTADIGDGEVKSADLGSSAVTNSKIANDAVDSAKIADGTIAYADFSRSSVRVEHRDDCNCGGTGWDPNGLSRFESTVDDAVNPNSVISIGLRSISNTGVCYAIAGGSGEFTVICDNNIPEGTGLNYAVFNHP